MLLLVKMILDPAHSKAVKRKVSDPAKSAKKPIFYCGSCENIPKGKSKAYRDFCVACIYVMYGFTTNVLGFQEKKNKMMLGFAVLVKSWIQH